MTSVKYIQGRVVGIQNSMCFVLELDELYSDSEFNRKETIIITDLDWFSLWTRRGLKAHRMLKKVLKGKMIGMTFSKRDEEGRLLVTTSTLSRYIKNYNG